MANFLRQKYKEKPVAWGSFESVQRSLFKNAEKIGIDSDDISRFIFGWSPGNQIDYAKSFVGTSTNIIFQKNRLNFNGSNFVEFMPPWESSNDPVFYTVFALASVAYSANTQQIMTWAKNITPFNGYCLSIRQVNAATLKLDTYWGVWGTNNSTFPINTNVLLSTKGKKSASGWCKVSANGYPYKTIHSKNSTIYATAPTQNLYLGKYAGGEFLANGGYISFSALLRTEITDSQIALLSDNPYQLLQRQPDVYYSIPVTTISTTQESSFKILSDTTQESSYKILHRSVKDVSYMILSKLSQESAWQILLSSLTEQSLAWKILNSEERETSWQITLSNILEQALSWKIFNSETQNSAYNILNDSSAISAWKISISNNANATWNILNEKTIDSTWKIKHDNIIDTTWKILNVNDTDLAYSIKNLLENNSDWKIFNTETINSSWSLLSDIIPSALYEFIQSQRTTEFSQTERTFIFNQAQRTFIFFR